MPMSLGEAPMSLGEAEREREKERESQADATLSAQNPTRGLKLTNCEIMT